MIHKQLKEIAENKLIECGFSDEQIFKEKSIKIGGKRYRIDVAGFSDKKIAIECGNVELPKIKTLLDYFDE
jgi:hypothetical protein